MLSCMGGIGFDEALERHSRRNVLYVAFCQAGNQFVFGRRTLHFVRTSVSTYQLKGQGV